jgi:uncharacterized protein
MKYGKILLCMAESPAGVRMHAFKEYVDRECKGCKHIRYCRGGCPYNAIAPTNGEIKGVDPHCIAYQRIFDEIADRFNQEMMGSLGLGMIGPGSQKGNNSRPGIMSLMQKMIAK